MSHNLEIERQISVRSFKSILTLSAILVIAAGQFENATAQLRIGYLNSQEIMSKSSRAKAVNDSLETMYKTWEKKALSMQQEIQQKQEQLEAQALVLTEKLKAERATELQNLALQLQQFQQEKLGPQGEFYKEQNRRMRPIVEEVQSIIDDIGEENNFDYIFDVVDGRIVYTSPGQRNLTTDVIERLK